MRLLQIIPTHGRGGCEDYALTIAKAAVGRGWELHAGIPPAAGTDSLAADYAAIGATVHRVAVAPGPDEHPHQLRGLAVRTVRANRLLRRVRPTVAHVVLPTPQYGTPVMLAAAVTGVPALVVFQLVKDDVPPLRGRLGRWLTWARRRQRWVAVSDHNRGLLAHIYGVERSEYGLVYNGASAPAVRPDRVAARAALCAELAAPADAVFVLGVGRLHPQKGFDLLVPAAAQFVKDDPRVRVLIAGPGEQEQLARQARQIGLNGRLALLGPRSDVPSLLAAADLFVFPSRYEGHPFALVEAMAAGLPVVAAAVSGIPELIADGVNGRLCRANDPCDLLEAVRAVLRDPDLAARMGAAGRVRAADFSAERMVAETFAEFERLVPPPPTTDRSSP